jgi:hypothetical protein
VVATLRLSLLQSCQVMQKQKADAAAKPGDSTDAQVARYVY